jgi:hypothetical protein
MRARTIVRARRAMQSSVGRSKVTVRRQKLLIHAEINLNRQLPLRIPAAALMVGALLGLAGTFAPSVSLRGLAWGIDGTALILASALLSYHHLRIGNDTVAAGFLVFAIGESLILSVGAADSVASSPAFGAGAALWASALALCSVPSVFPLLIRALGAIATVLLAVMSVQIFMGLKLSPLSHPLPFFAYPFLAATLLGWAWWHLRSVRQNAV